MNKLLTFAGALAVAALPLKAQWSLINDFNDPSSLDSVTDDIGDQVTDAASSLVDGYLSVHPGSNLDETTINLWTIIDLGQDVKAASLAADGFVTFYIELALPTVDDGAGGTRQAIVDTVFGPYNTDDPYVERYNNFNAMARINFGNQNLEPRDGANGYVSQGTLTSDTNYKIWYLIDFLFNEWKIYIQGGTEWPEQTLLMSSETSDIFTFRQDPADIDTVDTFVIALSRGNTSEEKGRDPTYFDNFYIDTSGENLTDPVGGSPKGPGIFADLDLDPNGWVTTSWMGPVNTNFYPWCYAFDFDTFFFATGSDTTSPVWIYLLR